MKAQQEAKLTNVRIGKSRLFIKDFLEATFSIAFHKKITLELRQKAKFQGTLSQNHTNSVPAEWSLWSSHRPRWGHSTG